MDLSPRAIVNQAWSGDNFKKKGHLNELYTWARNTVVWHWSADALFDSCILTMDVQCQVEHKKYALDSKLFSVPFHNC